MRPPICDLCGKRFDASDGGLVRFADYEPLPNGRVGHPKGVLWFCPRHIAAAEKRSEQPSTAAIESMRRRAPIARLLGLFRRGS